MTELEKWKNECAELNDEITRLRALMADDNMFANRFFEYEKTIQESSAANARLRAALEYYSNIKCAHSMAESCGLNCLYFAAYRVLATTDGQNELEAVKEALVLLRQHKCSVTYERLSEAFGLEK